MECIGGCDGGGLPSTPEVIGVAAGLASLAVAFYAIKISLGSLRIAEEQHQVFLRDQRAHADFVLTIRSPGTDGVIETSATRLKIVWTLNLDNIGNKAARLVHVAFSVPRLMDDLRWEEGKNDSLFSKKAGPYPVREPLTDSSDVSYKAQVVAKRADYIGRGGSFTKVSAVLELANVGGEQKLPMRLLVRSDDLPKDVDIVKVEDEILVRRVAAAITATTS